MGSGYPLSGWVGFEIHGPWVGVWLGLSVRWVGLGSGYPCVG